MSKPTRSETESLLLNLPAEDPLAPPAAGSDTQIDLAKVDAYERKNQKRSTVLGRTSARRAVARL